MKWIVGILHSWRDLIVAIEQTLVSNVAATVPWLAPVAPAYMAWHNSVNLLGWPVWVAWMVAAAVEGLGMSVVSTAFELWDWNDTKHSKDQNAPVLVAIVAVVFYLAVVVSVNVLLDLGLPVWIAKALLSLLSVPAVVTLALRSQHARRVNERERLRKEARDERREAREAKLKLAEGSDQAQKVSVKVSENEPVHPDTFGKWKHWTKVPRDERMKIAGMTDVRQVMDTYGVSERTGYNWMRDARNEMVAELEKASEQLAENSNQSEGG